MTTTAVTDEQRAGSPHSSRRSTVTRTLLTQRPILVSILLVLVLVVMTAFGAAGMLSGSYNARYLSAVTINAVPLAMLGLAQTFVIVSGRGGIDLSVGSMVSLVGMVFGLAYGQWGVPLALAIVLALVLGAVLGAINGFLIAYIGFPALIATLATFYAYGSLALTITGSKPVNSPLIQGLYSTARAIQLPFLTGREAPRFPIGLFLFLIPTVIVCWYLMNRSPFGRRLYAIGTNDVAGRWAGISVASVRMRAYIASGVISGLVAVVTVGQFASARPDAGNSGNGMALPAITIAVLGGVAITGGIGRVSGIVLAAFLVVWLNAGILLLFPGNSGTQYQLFALGAVLVLAALLNGYTNRRFHVLG